MRRLRRTAHVTVIALPLFLTLVATLPLAGGLIWSGVETRQITLDNAMNRFRRLIELINAELDARVETISGLIVAVATDFGGDRLTSDTAACSRRLQQLTDLLDSLDMISVINLQGTMICTSRMIPPGVNVADRGYFRQAIETKALVVDTPVRSRITGRPTIPISIALRDLDGRITGVLVASIDILRLLDTAAARSGVPQASLGLWDRGGALIARMPELSTAMAAGLTAVERGLLKEGDVESHAAGPVLLTLEGQWRVFVADYLSFGGQRLLISADVLAEDLYREVDSVFRRSLLGAGSLTFLSLVMAGLVYGYAERRLLRQLAERLDAAPGEAHPSTGPGLSMAFLLDEVSRPAPAPPHAPPQAG